MPPHLPNNQTLSRVFKLYFATAMGAWLSVYHLIPRKIQQQLIYSKNAEKEYSLETVKVMYVISPQNIYLPMILTGKLFLLLHLSFPM